LARGFYEGKKRLSVSTRETGNSIVDAVRGDTPPDPTGDGTMLTKINTYLVENAIALLVFVGYVESIFRLVSGAA